MQITDKSIKCYICGNIFHTKTGCTKIRINDLKNVISNNDSFACHQCLEYCFPFNNLNNPDFLQTIENSTSEIDMNRINNLVFDPFKSLNNSETENLDESAINPVIENSYYMFGILFSV